MPKMVKLKFNAFCGFMKFSLKNYPCVRFMIQKSIVSKIESGSIFETFK